MKENLKVEEILKYTDISLEKKRTDSKESENYLKLLMEKEQDNLVMQSETEMNQMR